MRRRSSDPRSIRIPLGLIGMMGLLVCIETGLGTFSADLTGEIPFAWRWGAQAVARHGRGTEILCFGDSLIKHGVEPRLIERQTGRSAYNLAITGGRTVNSYYFLRRALAAGARPTAVVLDADLLGTPPFEHPYLWPQLATPGEACEMAWLGRDPDFLAGYVAAAILPSVRCRFEIRNQILGLLRGRLTPFRVEARRADRSWRQHGGTTIRPATEQLAAEAVAGIDSWPATAPVPGQWSCHPTNAIYLDRFLDLAAGRGIPVFWVFPPHYRMLERYFDRPNWSGLQRQFARDRLDRYSNIVVVDGIHAHYDRDLLIDVSHLNQGGAAAFSTALGSIIRDHLARPAAAGPAWVELPAIGAPSSTGSPAQIAASPEPTRGKK